VLRRDCCLQSEGTSDSIERPRLEPQRRPFPDRRMISVLFGRLPFLIVAIHHSLFALAQAADVMRGGMILRPAQRSRAELCLQAIPIRVKFSTAQDLKPAGYRKLINKRELKRGGRRRARCQGWRRRGPGFCWSLKFLAHPSVSLVGLGRRFCWNRPSRVPSGCCYVWVLFRRGASSRCLRV